MNPERPTCPECGASHVARFCYGFPNFSEELRRELDAKRVTLGGCCIGGDDPQWHCNECQHEWRSDQN
ncbi:MAG: hypothetical protein CMJ48_01975 [Planctomycetaceae bacterium]|nr:hypothetical protein [Planctomycetaceae bacterium]